MHFRPTDGIQRGGSSARCRAVYRSPCVRRSFVLRARITSPSPTVVRCVGPISAPPSCWGSRDRVDMPSLPHRPHRFAHAHELSSWPCRPGTSNRVDRRSSRLGRARSPQTALRVRRLARLHGAHGSAAGRGATRHSPIARSGFSVTNIAHRARFRPPRDPGLQIAAPRDAGGRARASVARRLRSRCPARSSRRT